MLILGRLVHKVETAIGESTQPISGTRSRPDWTTVLATNGM